MLKRKKLREKGKIGFVNYFQKFNEGDRVAIIRELGLQPSFPKRIQGRSGIVNGKRGDHYIIKINDINKEKSFIIHPVHLRKLK